MQIKTVNPNFFIVRINKAAQKQKKETFNGVIARAATFTFGRGGMQCGEIVAIGKLAHLVIPFAKIGGTLHFSWKVEFNGEDASKPNMALVHEDKEYNYYTVTISEYKRRPSETYAYSDENGTYTHPSFVIMEDEEKKHSDKLLVSAGGILIYENYRMSDDEIQQKIFWNTEHIYSLSETHASLLQTRESESYPIKLKMQELERENQHLTALLQKEERIEQYTVAFSNPLHDVTTGDKVMANNIFFLEPLFINGKKYFIGQYKQIHAGIKTEALASTE